MGVTGNTMMNASRLGLLALMLTLTPGIRAQETLQVPDEGWGLWLDTEATWENDTLYLPDDVNFAQLPSNAPTGGWLALGRERRLMVTLPTTVEEHLWGAQGLRPYKGEYFYEVQDSSVRNGNYRGVSWWWRDINVPATFSRKKVILFVRAARLRAEVYLNEHLVGYNSITEASFTCDVSEAVQAGRMNRIAIRITNPGGRLDWLDTQLLTWGPQKLHNSHGFGGLDRGIVLSAHEPVYIEDAWVFNTPDAQTITAHARVMNSGAATAEGIVRWEIVDPVRPGTSLVSKEEPLRLDAASALEFRTALCLESARLWSPSTPRLYTMKVTVTAKPSSDQASAKDTSWVDSRGTPFGFRWFTADSVGTNAVLRLNGDRIRLYSAISWGFWGRNGLWPSTDLAEREVRAAKLFGMNCLQFHRNIGKAEVLDMQDRLGLLRSMEPGGGQTSLGENYSLYAPSPTVKIDDSGAEGNAKSFAERYMEEKIVRMIRDHRSHPSLVLYCLQNEIHPDLRNPRIFRVLRRMHAEDPSRIIVLKSGFPSGKPSMNQVWIEPYSDVVRYDAGDGISGWWDDHTVGGPGVWRDDMYRGPDDFTHRSTMDKEVVLWGEMLGAAVPDNHAGMIRELMTAGGTGYDLEDHRQILAAYDRFLDRWGFRTAFPTADALFVSIGNKSYDFWGRVIETARLAEASDYFVMSGWESTAIENHSGLLDNLRGFKGNPELIRKRLAPLRVVIKPNSLVFAKNDAARMDFFVLNESGKPHGTQLSVRLETPDGSVHDMAAFRIPDLQRDRFVYPVAPGFRTPPLTQEGTYRIYALIEGMPDAGAREEILVVDPSPYDMLIRKAGIITQNPSLLKPFEIVPGLTVEPFTWGKEYDLIIAANRFVVPPSAETEPERKIVGTEDEQLYRTIHYGEPENFAYLFSELHAEKARVTLRFVEAFQNAPGVRVFDVAVNGETILKDFDVYAVAGGKDIACDTSFTVPLYDGCVEITVPRVSAGSARFAAIKIEAGDSVIAINCGGKPYRDKNGLLWKPYEPSVTLDDAVLEKVWNGAGLLVLAEGEVAAGQYAQRLAEAGAWSFGGVVGEARASWMGSWYFVRDHPVYAGLPVDAGMGSYYQIPVANSCGVLLEGKQNEVFVGYSRDHDRNVGAGGATVAFGRGRILFHCVPGVVSGLRGTSAGMHPVLLRRLIANSLKYLQQGGN